MKNPPRGGHGEELRMKNEKGITLRGLGNLRGFIPSLEEIQAE